MAYQQLKQRSEIQSMRIYIIIIIILASSESFAQDNIVIGYITDSFFHPIIHVSEGVFSLPNSKKPTLPPWLKNAFIESDVEIQLSEPIKYADIYGPDKPGYYGETSIITQADRGSYFANLENPLKDLKFENREKVILNFYQFLSQDSWGKHFISREILNLTVDQIAQKSEVKIHFVTDLDSDLLYELWISYKLMYGKIGNMVYEQTKDSKWLSITNHCFNCD